VYRNGKNILGNGKKKKKKMQKKNNFKIYKKNKKEINIFEINFLFFLYLSIKLFFFFKKIKLKSL
jgi:hypothetical protein